MISSDDGAFSAEFPGVSSKRLEKSTITQDKNRILGLNCIICFEVVSFPDHNNEQLNCSSTSDSHLLLKLFCDSMQLCFERFSSSNVFCSKCLSILVELNKLENYIEKLRRQCSKLKASITVSMVESYKTARHERVEGDESTTNGSSLGVIAEINNARRRIYCKYDAKVLIYPIEVHRRYSPESIHPSGVKIENVTDQYGENDGYSSGGESTFEKGSSTSFLSESSNVDKHKRDCHQAASNTSHDTYRKQVSVNTGDHLDLDGYQFRKINGKVQCGSCGRLFTSPKFAKRHIQRVHALRKSSTRSYHKLIEVRPGRFLYANKHTVTANGNVFRCGTCGVECSGKYRLMKHIRTKHMDSTDQQHLLGSSAIEVNPENDVKPFISKDSVIENKDTSAFETFDSVVDSFENDLHSDKGADIVTGGSKIRFVRIGPDKYLYGGKYPFEKVGNTYKCGTCGGTKNSKSRMLVHVRRIHFRRGKEKTRLYYKLEEIAPNEFMYANSIPVSLTDGLYKCGCCNFSADAKSRMFFHIRVKHLNVDTQCTCDICGTSLRNRRALLKHQKLHISNQSCACIVCGKIFKNKKYMQDHAKIHNGDSAKNFQCEFCGKKFFTGLKLASHVASHTGEKKFQCPYCNDKFKSYNYMSAHRKLCRDKQNAELIPVGSEENP